MRACVSVLGCTKHNVIHLGVIDTELLRISGHSTTGTTADTPVTASILTGGQYQTGVSTQASGSVRQPSRQTPTIGMHGQTSGT